MQVTAEQTDPCTIVLDIAVDEQQVSRTFDSVYREFGRHANVPGFRPGKAPRAVVERFVDRERVRERALEKLLTESYRKAIEDEAITPYRSPQIDPPALEDKKPYEYKAIIPLEPQVTLGEYTGLTIEKPIFKIAEEDIERSITRMRESRARLERIGDRGVEPGDVLIMENQIVLEGEENPEPARRQLVQLGANVPGFDEAVMGMNPNEERTFELTYPEEFDDEARRGKKATFHVKLNSISAKKLPELTDEFAKQMGADSVEALRQQIRDREEARAKELSEEVAESRLIAEILQRATIHFPEMLIREEVEDELRRLAAELRQSSVTYEQYLAQMGATREAHQTALAAQAAEQIRSVLALRQIAEQEGIAVTDADVDIEFERMRNEGVFTEDQYDEYRRDDRRRLQLANALSRQRLHDFLFAHNTIQEVEQNTPPDSDQAVEQNTPPDSDQAVEPNTPPDSAASAPAETE